MSTMRSKDELYAIAIDDAYYTSAHYVSAKALPTEPIGPEFLRPSQVIKQLNQDPVWFRFTFIYACYCIFFFTFIIGQLTNIVQHFYWANIRQCVNLTIKYWHV